jgi:uncharacterized protein YndB with AHSA1/START domain
METSETVHEVTIEADPATVFAFFTDPDRLIRWMGTAAQLKPEPGGVMLLEVHPGWTARGEFKEVIPLSHLAYTFGWEQGTNVPPGSSLIEVDLMPKNGGTIVHFTHSGLPPEQVAPHREGWDHYLSRLAIVAAGGDPGPDPRVHRS